VVAQHDCPAGELEEGEGEEGVVHKIAQQHRAPQKVAVCRVMRDKARVNE
jgi:hypothetical protein